LKYKTQLPPLLLLILLMLLLTQTSFAQTPTELPESSAHDYGIEPEKLYPAAVVMALMQTAEAEIEAAVNEAYAEGYKAAMLQYAPDIAALRITEAASRKELEAERRKQKCFWPAAGVSFIAGFAINYLIMR